MKVLNRPMFRMGGPIKEGIMSGIKEPRQRYAEQPGFVVPNYHTKIILNRFLNNQNNAARVFENVGKTIQDNKPIVNESIFKTAPVKNTYSTFDMAEAAPSIIPTDDEVLQQQLKVVANKANKGKRLTNEDMEIAEKYGITYGKELFESENRADIESKNIKRATSVNNLKLISSFNVKLFLNRRVTK